MSNLNNYELTEHDYANMDILVENEILCNNKYCDWYKHASPNNPTCEGNYCEQAYRKYIEIKHKN